MLSGMKLNLNLFAGQFLSVSPAFYFTHRVVNAIVVARVWIEGTQLHPAKTHFVLSWIKEPTYVCPGLKEMDRQTVFLCVRTQ